jgi:hypothetical protein
MNAEDSRRQNSLERVHVPVAEKVRMREALVRRLGGAAMMQHHMGAAAAAHWRRATAARTADAEDPSSLSFACSA